MSAAVILPNHSELKRSSVFSRSSTLNTCEAYVFAFSATSSGESALRVALFPLGSPIIPVKSPIRKDDLVSEQLKLPHLVQQHGVTKMQIRRRRVESGLDPQWAAQLQPGFQALPS